MNEITTRISEYNDFFTAVAIIGFLFTEQFAVSKITLTWWSWLLVIIAVDFTYYWMHRIEHERRILWAVHSVHHATNADYIDKNYGGILIIWDRLFGTYQAENEKPIYGLTTQLGSSNPLTINFREFRTIYTDVIHAESASHKASYAFGRTGWQPRRCPQQTVDK
jgi:sterol desaturase/sphingolipid hydroxylase (fatty acid hydroxylase superfamily)